MGRTVATLEENDLAQFSVKNWIDATGGDSNKVTWIHGIPMGEVGEPLNDGDLFSTGTIPVINFFVALEVVAGFVLVFREFADETRVERDADGAEER